MRHDRKAFTLVEFLMAIAIMSVTALAVAGVSMALSSAYAQGENFYQYLQDSRAGTLSIQEAINNAKLVTAAGSNGLVLWTKDTNSDGAINLSELSVISLQSNDGEITQSRVVFPASMDATTRTALDESKTLDWATNLSAVQSAVATSPYKVETVLTSDVRSFTIRTPVNPPLTTLVQIEITLGDAKREFTVNSAASLRADCTDDVSVSKGEYVLTTDSNTTTSDNNGNGGGNGNGNGNGKNK
ncbi:MAG TPA: prepilin-type N-terminal cleavage/methylation domain-containing protein [Phycisphaerae bacterium]|nr:prepilin-type N-terminal cleavage/methylation domain-containing protein [Phycisphaerae bacterium]